MNRSRTLWLILFGVPLLLVAPVVLIGSTIGTSGMVQVQVHEKNEGCSFRMNVPAAIVPVALSIAPDEIFSEIHHEMGREGRNALPIVRAVLRELSHCPDGVLVDVTSRDEVVTIEKRNGTLQVLVDTPDELVRVSVPLKTVGSVLSRLT